MASRIWARVAAAYLALVVVMAAVGAIAGGDEEVDAIEALEPPAPRAAFPLETRSPQVVGGSNVRVLVALRRPALGELSGESRRGAAAQRAYVRSLTREVRALQSALAARGVTFGDPVIYTRVWSGFAATVSTRDLNEVQAAGLRVEPVRRVYPAGEAGAPTATTAPPAAGTLRLRARPTLALLDSAVAAEHPRLAGRVEEAADLLGTTRTPPGRRDEHGTQMAGVAAAGLPPRARILALRVAGLQARPEGGGFEESGTTDQLLAGLERAVDPDADGDAEDAAPVALVGVVSPYAGFDHAPEADAARAAAELGTLVVAPAGNQGPGGGRYGTIGSPAASAAVLAAGALAGPVAVRAATLTLATPGGSTAVSGELIGGDPRGVEGGVTTRPAKARRAILVSAGDPARAAQQAVAAGAAALVLCRAEGEPAALPRGAAGGLPAIALTGDAARAALAAARAGEGVGELAVGGPRPALERMLPARSSSAGPTYGLRPKPDVVAAGSARAPLAAGGEGYAAGTSIAAARVAAQAALLRAARPELDARTAAALLAETGRRPAGVPLGVPDARRAAAAGAVATPHALRVPAGGRATLTLRNLRGAPVRAALKAKGLDVPAVVRLAASGERRVRIAAPRGAAPGPRTIAIRAGETELAVEAFVPPAALPARLGPLRLVTDGGRVEGVRFAAGRLRRAPAPAIEPVGRLVLRLEGPEDRELTPPGGARDLLPAEYAYTLAREVLGGLPGGSYRFVVRARGPAGGATLVRRSPSFRLP